MSFKDRIKELIRVPAGDLLPNPKNWRQHPEKQRSALSGVLAEVGWADAVLARETADGLMLIDGHLRTEVAPDSEIPVLVLDVSEDEADKILLTHDPLADMAETNAAALDSLMRDVNTGSEGVQEMLAELADSAGLYPEITEQSVTEDEVPEPPKKAITKAGDIWQLGSHRICCGDATDPSDIKRLMGRKQADLCFTSPPYAQQRDYDGNADVTDWDKLMNGVCENLPMSKRGQVLVNLGLVHHDGQWLPYWDQWLRQMVEIGWRRFGLYVWDQGFGLPGNWNGRFAPSFELVFHFNKENLEPIKHVKKKSENINARRVGGSTMRGKDGICREFTNPAASAQPTKIPDSVIRINRQHGGHDIDHPAVFPVDLPAHIIKSWSGRVYDPFLGSGTTLIAAEQLGRECYGMEISPHYCDVIIERWQNLTGQKAKKVTDGT